MSQDQMIDLLLLLNLFSDEINGAVGDTIDNAYNEVLHTVCQRFNLTQLEALAKMYAKVASPVS